MMNILKTRFVSVLRIITLVAVIGFSMAACGFEDFKDYTEGDFTFQTFNDGTEIMITKYNGNAATVDIPAQIKDIPVTSIAHGAFRNCINLTSVSSSSVTSIWHEAFSGCENLTSVSLPAVTIIVDYAFSDCKSLTSVSFPAATSIGGSAFKGCASLTSVSFPAVTNIGWDAFSDCYNVTRITLGTITEDNFGGGDSTGIRYVYFGAGGGPGTYTRESGGNNTAWTKQ